MGQVPKQTVDESILYPLDRTSDLEMSRLDFAATAMKALREEIRDAIKDSFWACPMHNPLLSTADECEDCVEAREVNVILSSILELEVLK